MKADLSGNRKTIVFGDDHVVIPKYIAGIAGGRTLDVTGITDTYLKAGHVIIRQTSTGTYKPLGVTSGAYVALPEGHTYAGILATTVLTSNPSAPIMTNGQVNETASPYPVASIKAAIVAALPTIQFVKDEEA
ncbi:MAG: hypothetical protein K6G73_12385 [Marinilabiliaceae bacterium]|nr:hypothetical protein [Marinilabiliaceae bacterium]